MTSYYSGYEVARVMMGMTIGGWLFYFFGTLTIDLGKNAIQGYRRWKARDGKR